MSESEHLTKILDVLHQAIENGKTVTIKADEITISESEATASGLEITIE